MISEFTQDNLDAGQGKEALIGLQQAVVPNMNVTVKAQPCVSPLHDITQPIPMRSRMLAEWRPSAARSLINPLRDNEHGTTPSDDDDILEDILLEVLMT